LERGFPCGSHELQKEEMGEDPVPFGKVPGIAVAAGFLAGKNRFFGD
jgi:hypothetical protein